MAGWGTVALHGQEGFRAERAAALCLFTDRPWAAATQPRAAPRRGDRLREALARPAAAMASVEPETAAESWHTAALVAAAARYAVPLVSLRGAVTLGLLSELGVPRPHVEAAGRLGALA